MIKNRFSAAAETYDRHARPQISLAKSVVSVLPEMNPERILELGCGTGQLTRLLIDRFPGAQIDAVDVAEKMIEYSRREFRRFPQVNWLRGDAQIWRGKGLYPLITSSAALHWTPDLRKTFENIFQGLETGGFFALGMMLRGTLGELRTVRSEVAPNKTAPITLPALDDVENGLQSAGFHILSREQNTEQVSYTSASDFLRVIHEQGVTGSTLPATRIPLNRTEISRLIKLYQDRYRATDGVYATYQTATFLLTK